MAMEDDFNIRLFQAYSEMKNPRLDSVNPHFKSRYASLESCLEAVRPPLQKYGIRLTQGRRKVSDTQFVLFTSVVDSVTGAVKTLDERLIDSLSNTQQQQSDETYKKRGAICAAFALVGAEDDDGEEASNKEPLADYLKALGGHIKTISEQHHIPQVDIVDEIEHSFGKKIRSMTKGETDKVMDYLRKNYEVVK